MGQKQWLFLFLIPSSINIHYQCAICSKFEIFCLDRTRSGILLPKNDKTAATSRYSHAVSTKPKKPVGHFRSLFMSPWCSSNDCKLELCICKGVSLYALSLCLLFPSPSWLCTPDLHPIKVQVRSSVTQYTRSIKKDGNVANEAWSHGEFKPFQAGWLN